MFSQFRMGGVEIRSVLTKSPILRRTSINLRSRQGSENSTARSNVTISSISLLHMALSIRLRQLHSSLSSGCKACKPLATIPDKVVSGLPVMALASFLEESRRFSATGIVVLRDLFLQASLSMRGLPSRKGAAPLGSHCFAYRRVSDRFREQLLYAAP